MPELKINGHVVQVQEGTTIIEAAKSIGIDIPTLCYDKDLSPAGICRICMVEIEGSRNLITACNTPVKEGMIVETEPENVIRLRKMLLNLLLADHPMDCLTCEKTGNCRLQDLCYRYDIKKPIFTGSEKNYEIDTSNHLIERDRNKCILCGKCIRVCYEIQGTSTVDFVGRGYDTQVTTAYDKSLSMDNCRFCGQCIDICPTAALVNKQMKGTRPWEVEKVTTICPFCGVGCTIDLNIKNGKVVGVTGNKDNPVNGMSMCVKGRFHTDMIYSPDRITTPLIKENGTFREATWDEALDLVTNNLSQTKTDFGSDAICALSSARCTNEENWVMQKFIRAVIGTNNVDHCART